MADTPKTRPLVDSRITLYRRFRGVDRAEDRSALDTGENQRLWTVHNAFVNLRGEIERAAPHRRRINSPTSRIQAARFYNQDTLVWAESDGDGVHFNSDRGHRLFEACAPGSVASLISFKRRIYATCAGYRIRTYDGGAWSTSRASVQPAVATAAAGRLAVAGMADDPATVQFSRLGNTDVFVAEETSTASDKAAFIDISELTDEADEIVGLGSFSVNRLAIFTPNQTFVYRIDPDYNQWSIDENANVQYGCISHATICKVGTDLFFCSRMGVHSLSRNENNGLTIKPLILSDPVATLYQANVRLCDDPRLISAVYDQDAEQYHVFFPRPGIVAAERMTLSMKGGLSKASWSTGDAAYANCGDSLAGQLVLGGPGGLYNMLDRNVAIGMSDPNAGIERPAMEIQTPILWHGDIINEKQSRALILHAAGSGRILVEAYDETGEQLMSRSVAIETPAGYTTRFPDHALQAEYEIPFGATYRGVQIRIKSQDDGDARIIAIGVDLVNDTINF